MANGQSNTTAPATAGAASFTEERKRYLALLTDAHSLVRRTGDDVYRITQALILASDNLTRALIDGRPKEAEQALASYQQAARYLDQAKERAYDATEALDARLLVVFASHIPQDPEACKALAAQLIRERLEEFATATTAAHPTVPGAKL